jgi:hypothetical protein
LPDSTELAADIAHSFGIEIADLDLPSVAQYVYSTTGRSPLYNRLKQILTVECEPAAVHQFLARFPGQLEAQHLPKSYQLILTTNYDTALERAFDEEGEPYDLAVFMASGEDAGCFMHLPFQGEPEVIHQPNRYTGFPIDDDFELHRTIIMKIHGTVDGTSGDYRWKENYVITEDQYIEYLSARPVGNYVPLQLLEKLRSSHSLFLGYAIQDWHLRVFLKRIWAGQALSAKSWAIESDPDVLEKDLWGFSGVELFSIPLAEYVAELSQGLTQLRMDG